MTLDPNHYRDGLQKLPNVSFRHLEVFQAVHREGSYANAAHELRTTRANVKRICQNFEKEMKHRLFEEDEHQSLSPTPFGLSVLTHSEPLMRSLLHLGEGIRSIQRKGLILRFAASNGFFSGGAFSYILSRIDILDLFRPCYLRIDPDRYNAALLSSECDVYFGAGIHASKRLEIIHLDRVPWSFHRESEYDGEQPEFPDQLVPGKWLIQPAGDKQAAESVLKELHKAGARKGRILSPSYKLMEDEILLKPESSWMGLVNPREEWPTFLFSAALKKQHPYGELIARLKRASRV